MFAGRSHLFVEIFWQNCLKLYSSALSATMFSVFKLMKFLETFPQPFCVCNYPIAARTSAPQLFFAIKPMVFLQTFPRLSPNSKFARSSSVFVFVIILYLWPFLMCLCREMFQNNLHHK